MNAPTIGAEIQLPFGGTKHTGNGYREAGRRGIEQFSETKTRLRRLLGPAAAGADRQPSRHRVRRADEQHVNGADSRRPRAARRGRRHRVRPPRRAQPRAVARVRGGRHPDRADAARAGLRATRPTATPARPASVGVALVTTGPGAANTIGAVGEAWASRSPVVVIATDIPTTLRRPGVYRGVLHECTDQAALFAPVTKTQTAKRRRRRCVAATTAPAAPTGPVYVGIPTDLPDRAAASTSRTPCRGAVAARRRSARSLDALRRSERPLLWVGGGARDAGDEDRRARTRARRAGRDDLPSARPARARPSAARARAAARARDHRAHRRVRSRHRHRLRPRPDEHDAVAAAASRRDASRSTSTRSTRRRTTRSTRSSPPTRASSVRSPTSCRPVSRGPGTCTASASPSARASLPTTRRATRSRSSTHRDRAARPTRSCSPTCASPATGSPGTCRVETRRGLHYPMGWGTLGFAPAAAIGAAVARPDAPTGRVRRRRRHAVRPRRALGAGGASLAVHHRRRRRRRLRHAALRHRGNDRERAARRRLRASRERVRHSCQHASTASRPTTRRRWPRPSRRASPASSMFEPASNPPQPRRRSGR